jgi:Na+-translocating ferredoxin:NAD+ oxidoreductase RnfD subunit
VPRSALGRFFRTPKGLLLLVLAIVLGLAFGSVSPAQAAPCLVGAIGAAALLDLPIRRWREGSWEFPSGAVLTGLIIAMVLSAHEPWYVGAVTSAVAIVSKYVLRSRQANLFNPAALAVVATFYVFNTGQDWWGALPEFTPALLGLAVLLASGLFITDRVKKLPMALSFLGGYFGLFTLTAFVSSPAHVAEIFRTPDLQATLFFAFFILTDPPTSPTRARDQVFCGALVAASSYVVFEWVGAAYYLLAGVLVGNGWEAWRRWRVRRERGLARPPVVAGA